VSTQPGAVSTARARSLLVVTGRVVPPADARVGAQWAGATSPADFPVPGRDPAERHGLRHGDARLAPGRRPFAGRARSLCPAPTGLAVAHRAGGAALWTFHPGPDPARSAATHAQERPDARATHAGACAPATPRSAAGPPRPPCGPSCSPAFRAASRAAPPEDTATRSAGTSGPAAAWARADAGPVCPGGQGHILGDRGTLPSVLGVDRAAAPSRAARAAVQNPQRVWL
jgi:hypothetical protein